MNTARHSLTGIPRPAVASLGLGLLALSGCFNPTPPANVLCAPDGWCPSGQTCDTNRWTCVGEGEIPDAGPWPWFDSSWPPWPPPDSAVPPDANLGEGIAAALAAPWGPTSIPIKEVLVTYVKPAVDPEPQGFFVQSDPYGPAMFVAAGPSFAGVRLTAGDRISFRIYNIYGLYGSSVAGWIGELVLHSRGNDVSSLVQDVSWVSELVTDAASYSAELISAELSVAGSFNEDPYGFLAAPVATNSVFGDGRLVVRLPKSLQDSVGLEDGCSLQLHGVPFWRYWDEAILPVHDFSELLGVSCPATRITLAQAETDTSVRLRFSRALDPSSVQADGSQFAIAGLTVTAAAVNGREVMLTTSPQTPGQTYMVDDSDSVRDVFGRNIGTETEPSFVGRAPSARLRINEVKANIAPSCDLLELQVTQGGSLDGIVLTRHNVPVYTFRELLLATGDLIVVHFNSLNRQCNPGRSPSESQAPDQYRRTPYEANFDTAYDIHVVSAGLDVAPHTLAVFDASGRMLDAVLLTSIAGAPDSGSEQEAAAAAEAGEWRTLEGTVPPGGFRNAAFRDHAAGGLDADPVTVVNGWSGFDGKASVQRSGNNDNNHKGDWTTAPHSFGLLNPGQSPL